MDKSSRPTFAIMGSGGMGGYIGAKLAKADYQVAFLARGSHLKAIKNNGLKIEGPDEVFLIDPIRATSDPRDIGPVDFVIFCVKLWDTEAAGEQCRDLVGPNTAFLSMQNGVDAEPILSGIFGPEHVMGATSEIGANIIEPGFVRRFTPFATIRFGEFDQMRSARSIQISKAITAAGLAAEHVDNISLTIWDKFLWLVAASAMNCVTRQPFGAVREDPDTRALLRRLMEEVMSVGNAKGIPLTNENIETRLDYIDSLPSQAKVSIALDLERGNRLELPWLSGAVVRMGQELDVPTPANDIICAALKHYIMGRG